MSPSSPSHSAPSSPSSDTPTRSVLSLLVHRRVPQVGAIYLGGVWTGTEIAGWAVDRFVLSPHLEEVAFLALLLMLPAVLFLAYEYGAPGPDPWTRRSLVGVGANLLVTVALLAAVYGGTDLGSAQQTVQVAGLSGEMAERTVPKAKFRKRIGIFYFEAPADSLVSLRRVLPYALGIDLMQDLFVKTYTPAHLAERLREIGPAGRAALPLALRRDIALEYGIDFIVDGTIVRTEGPYRLTTVLRTTDDLDVVAERTFEGAALLPLIDQASTQLRRDLDVPSAHIAQTADLPVEEITTTSLTALKQYADGYDALRVQHDFAAGVAGLERAVATDPTFALAHFMRMYGYAMTGRHRQSAKARAAAQQHKYRLTEPFRYALRANQLIMERKMDAARQSVEQWTRLYPDDMMAWSALAQLQELQGAPAEAATSLRRIVALDPGQAQMRLKIAKLLSGAGQHREAVRELSRYTEDFPDRADGFTHLGMAYEDMGAPEKALAAHEEAYLRAPNDVAVLRNLGGAHLRLGHYAEAEAQMRAALAKSRTPEGRSRAWSGLARHAWIRGQYPAFRAYTDSLFSAQRRLQSGYMAVHSRTSYAYRLHRAGAPEQARAIVDAAEQGIEAIDEQNIDAAALHSMVARYYVETGRPEAATRHLEAAERIASAFGMTDVLLRVGYYHTRGQWLEARGRLEAAVAAYAGHVALDPSDTTSRLRIADLTYRMGRTAEAARYYRAVLQRRPGTPLAQAGYARLLYDTGKRAEARTHLDRALQAWSDSDPAFEPAAAARQLHAELTGRVGPAAASDSAGPTS